jgi:hypothetical protein
VEQAPAQIGAVGLRLHRVCEVAEDPKGGPSDYVVDLSYSYQVEGARYGGAYRESFRSEDQAKRSRRFFENLPVPVRYHPREPSRSVLDPHWLAALASRATVAGSRGELTAGPDKVS